MKEHPLLCNQRTVKAIWEGRQTQDRRLLKPQPFQNQVGQWLWEYKRGSKPVAFWPEMKNHGPLIKLMPYQVGDLLYCRETCKRFTGLPFNGRPWPSIAEWALAPCGNPYKALLHCVGNEGHIKDLKYAAACVTIPSIHMPKWAARIWMKVLGVRIEQIQNISWDDAVKGGWPGPSIDCDEYEGAVEWFKVAIWEPMYLGSWERGDWVRVTDFRRVER